MSGFVDPAALPPGAVLWSLLVGLGVYLLVTAQPIGRPRPDMRERLRRLELDERIRIETGRRERHRLFASRLLEGMLRPVLDDAGRLVGTLLARLGLGGGAELERRLRLVRPGVEPVQFFGEKVAAGAVGLGTVPLMAFLGIEPLGRWPAWALVVGVAAGFLVPDLDLERRVARRRAACLMELPSLLDMLTIAVSAGLALEQALVRVAEDGAGAVAAELRVAGRELALGQRRTLVDALGAVAERNAVPELSRFVDQLRAAHEHGVPLSEALGAQADALREQQRLRVVAEGGRASVRMLIPIAVLIMPPLFVVLLVPAGFALLRLGL